MLTMAAESNSTFVKHGPCPDCGSGDALYIIQILIPTAIPVLHTRIMPVRKQRQLRHLQSLSSHF